MSRSKRPPSRDEEPSAELVLAAVERAIRHRGPQRAAAPLWTILAHLAIPRRSAAARSVREQLHVLCVENALVSSRAHGVSVWALGAGAAKRLRERRDAGVAPALPESPQHAAWRAAHSAAGQEIERFRRRLRACLAEARSLLSASEPAGSDAWLELGERLQRACWLLASATHCLHEWAEPDDAHADIDTHGEPPGAPTVGLDAATLDRRRIRRAGRRNISLWREGR